MPGRDAAALALCFSTALVHIGHSIHFSYFFIVSVHHMFHKDKDFELFLFTTNAQHSVWCLARRRCFLKIY